jgi:hypothetical protein
MTVAGLKTQKINVLRYRRSGGFVNCTGSRLDRGYARRFALVVSASASRFYRRSPGMHDMAAQVRIPWPPGKLVARTRSVSNQNRRIAGTGRTHRHRNVAAGHIADAGDELAHRPASAGAEIERRALCTIEEQRAYRIEHPPDRCRQDRVFRRAARFMGRPKSFAFLRKPLHPYGATKMTCERMPRGVCGHVPASFMALCYFNAARQIRRARSASGGACRHCSGNTGWDLRSTRPHRRAPPNARPPPADSAPALRADGRRR